VEEEKKEKSFVVKDRRIFSETGEGRNEDGEEKEATSQEPAPEVHQQTEPEQSRASSDEDADYPEINFANFLISLSTSALFHFGDFADPATSKPEVNLAAAKQTIDIIGILDSKTKNNLTEEEKGLMENILFELRMRYVKEKAKAGK
jgi:Domain of unknown function (DUF1844)